MQITREWRDFFGSNLFNFHHKLLPYINWEGNVSKQFGYVGIKTTLKHCTNLIITGCLPKTRVAKKFSRQKQLEKIRSIKQEC